MAGLFCLAILTAYSTSTPVRASSISAFAQASTTNPTDSITDNATSPGEIAGVALLGANGSMGEASAVASYGELKAYASASGLATSQGFGRSTASFTDTLQVLSDVLADGTAVDVIITKQLGGEIRGGGTWGYVHLLVNGTSGYQQSVYPASTSTTGTLDPLVIHTTVGSSFGLVGLLDVQAWAYGTAFSTVTVDFSHTIDLYADSLTAGVMLKSESGHDYATSAAVVPEPGTLLLLAFGLIGVAGLRRKLRR